MTNQSLLKWILHSLVGAIAMLGFMYLGQSMIPVLFMIGRVVFPDSGFANMPTVMPFAMQIGGAVAVALAVFLAYWKRLLSVPQLILSLIAYDVMMIAYQCLLFPRNEDLFELIFSLDFLLRFNALTILPCLVGIGAAVGLRALMKRKHNSRT